MFSLSRREFLQGTAALGAASAASIAIADEPRQAARRGSANDQLHVAVIGVRGRGRSHVAGFANRHNCVVTHICDCDSGVIRGAMETARRQQGRTPTYVQDLRRIMDDRSIDIVAIATPNHWHALAAIWAMQNGKDVYVEKPVSHNVWEGRRMVEVARQHRRICQAGTQIRSMPGARQAIEFIRSGQLGRVRVARGLCYKPRGSIGRAGPQGGTIPSTIDYDLWCGPAPVQRPMRRIRLHYDWHWIWDYGNGDLGNQGIHQMDVARWALGQSGLARSVVSAGGRFGYVDDGETANTQVAVFDYGDAELIFEVRGLVSRSNRNDAYRGVFVGNVIHCENGYVVFPSYSSAVAYDNNNRVIRRFSGGGDHFGNFVQAVRSRRHQDLNGDIEEGHISSALCHLANISYRLGREVPFSNRDGFGGDREARETFQRMCDHLRAKGVALDRTNYRLGPQLRINTSEERFIDNERANQMLTRQYRRGFEVPARG